VVVTVTDAACCGSTVVTSCRGSATVAACCAFVATCGGSAVVAASCGSETSAAPCESPLATVAVLAVARDVLDERRLVGTAASFLSTLASAKGGTVAATLRTRRQES
jgi:hypothetical protein